MEMKQMDATATSEPCVIAEPLLGHSNAEPSSVNDNDETYAEKRANAAGCATGIISLFLVGPVGALILGFGANYAARKTPQDGSSRLGDSARAMGDWALSTQAKVQSMRRGEPQVAEKNTPNNTDDSGKSATSNPSTRANSSSADNSKSPMMDTVQDFVAFSCGSMGEFFTQQSERIKRHAANRKEQQEREDPTYVAQTH